MRRLQRFLAILAVLSVVSVPTLACAAEGTAPQVSPNVPSSGDLVVKYRDWDGKIVSFTGEAITEALERGAFSWIHVNDDSYYLKNVEEGAALGGYNSGHAVWLPTELTKKITYYGDYTHEGDVVTVKGVFNAACSQHGGDMDIHATSLDVAVVGHEFHEPVHPLKWAAAIVMMIAAAIAWLASRRVRNRASFGLGRI